MLVYQGLFFQSLYYEFSDFMNYANLCSDVRKGSNMSLNNRDFSIYCTSTLPFLHI